MASIENSLKYESEVEPGKVRLVTSGEFVRAYNHSAWLFYCCISKYKVIRKFSKAQQKDVYFLGFPVSKLLELTNGRVCMHQLGSRKAAFFMDKVTSIGKQLAAWHKSAVRDGRISNGAEPPSPMDGRPECAGSRPGAESRKVNPICGRVALAATDSAAKGSLTGNTEATS